jgi:glyceraldehyde 3-phosphate dehydrogenase
VFTHKVGSDEKGILVERNIYVFFHEKEISNLPWKERTSIVIEATGKYKTFEDLNAYIIAGAKKVILSARQ